MEGRQGGPEERLPLYAQAALWELKTVNEDSHVTWPPKEDDSELAPPPQGGMCHYSTKHTQPCFWCPNTFTTHIPMQASERQTALWYATEGPSSLLSVTMGTAWAELSNRHPRDVLGDAP